MGIKQRETALSTSFLALSGYSGDADPHSGHTDPPVDFGIKRYFNDNITVFF